MSNYTKTTNFTAKDSLSSGDPNKLIRGSDHDTEYAAIAVAIATKEDACNNNVANGYAPLDASARLPVANLPTDVALLSASSNTFTGGQLFLQGNTEASLWLRDTAATADEKQWRWVISGGDLYGQTYDDALSVGGSTWLRVNRTGTAVDSIALTAASVTANGQAVVLNNDARLTSFTSVKAGIAPASGGNTNTFLRADGLWTQVAFGNLSGVIFSSQVPLAAVSQHQGSLSLSSIGGQVTDLQVPVTAVTQHQGSLTLSSIGGSVTNAQVPSSAVTQYQSSINAGVAIAASQVTSGTFATSLIPASSIKCRNLPSLGGTNVTLQSDPGGTPAGSPGDMFMYY